MRLLILIISLWALAYAKPEMYKEKEDFQFSRSSSDEGSKSGYYGAQRGNMGGNYERAHNMDLLAQHQMSTLVRHVDGELGEGANTRTGSVFTSGNSRGIYGSGNYDLSNLKGRSFGEGVSYGDSQSQSAFLSQNSGYSGNAYSVANNGRYSASQLRALGLASQYGQIADQQAGGLYSGANNYEYGSQGANNYRYYTHSGSQERSVYDQSNTNLHSESNTDDSSKSKLITTPVRIYLRPGTRIAIPVSAQNYDASQNVLVRDQNTVNTEAEFLSNSGKQINVIKPVSNAKHYESSYSYRKEWEKHDTQPITVMPTENPFPQNSELYEDSQLSQAVGKQFKSEIDSAQSSNMNSAYASKVNSGYNSAYNANTKSAAANRLQYQSQIQNFGSNLASNAYTFDTHNSGASKKLNSVVEDINSKPKSYQSSYSYHKSWERHGDPYVIKPVGGDLNALTSQRLVVPPIDQNLYYGNQYGQATCDLQCHLRKRRSYHIDQYDPQMYQENLNPQSINGWLSDLPQQSSDHQNFEYLGQQPQNMDNLESLGQETQNQWTNLDLGQQTQNKWDNMESLNQQSESGVDNLSQLSQSQLDNLEDLGQETQDTWKNLETLNQKPQSDIENLGQETQNTWNNLESLNQHPQDEMAEVDQQSQSRLDNLEDLGQQTQNIWKNLETLNQKPQSDIENLGQETQNTWNNLETLNQKPQSKIEEVGQQSQSQLDQLEDLGQQTQNIWNNLETLNQLPQSKIEEVGQQSQSQLNELQDLGQQTQKIWNNLETLDQQPHSIIEEVGQQSQIQLNSLHNLGQQTQKIWKNLDSLNQHPQNGNEEMDQQSQSKRDNLEDLGQQTQDTWKNLETLNQKPQNDIENLGQETQNTWNNLEQKLTPQLESELNDQQTLNNWNRIEEQQSRNQEEPMQPEFNVWDKINNFESQQNMKSHNGNSNHQQFYSSHKENIDTWDQTFQHYNLSQRTNERKPTTSNTEKNLWDIIDKAISKYDKDTDNINHKQYISNQEWEEKYSADNNYYHNSHHFHEKHDFGETKETITEKTITQSKESNKYLVFEVIDHSVTTSTTEKNKSTEKPKIIISLPNSHVENGYDNIGRGDIGADEIPPVILEANEQSNGKKIEDAHNTLNSDKLYKTQDEIESLSLTHFNGNQYNDKLNQGAADLSVMGLEQHVESINTPTRKPKHNHYNRQNNFLSDQTLPKQYRVSNYNKPLTIERKPTYEDLQKSEVQIPDNFEQQNFNSIWVDLEQQMSNKQDIMDLGQQKQEAFNVNMQQQLYLHQQQNFDKDLQNKQEKIQKQDFHDNYNKNSLNEEQFHNVNNLQSVPKKDEIVEQPIEPTEEPGFWKSVWDKTVSAKDKVVSWFKN